MAEERITLIERTLVDHGRRIDGQERDIAELRRTQMTPETVRALLRDELQQALAGLVRADELVRTFAQELGKDVKIGLSRGWKVVLGSAVLVQVVVGIVTVWVLLR